MRIIRVKAKVVAKPAIEDVAFWKRAAEQNAELAKQIAGELDIEKKNHALATAGAQMWQRIAKENECDARNWKARADAAVKAKRDADDLALRAANDLVARLIKAMDEAEAARAEAEDLRLELMERGVRIEELERRIEWLQAHSNTGADFIS